MIKRIWIAAVLLICSAVLCPHTLAAGKGKPEWVKGEFIVKFKPGMARSQVKSMTHKHGSEILASSRFSRFQRLKVPQGRTAAQMVEIFRKRPEVEYAELNYIARAFASPNDSYYYLQWNFSDPYRGINAEAAWDITEGDPGTIVAVLDSGVAYEDYGSFQQAPDLASTSFVSPYDFINNDAHANDDDGHGTHVAGTIAQNTNNYSGAAGIAYDCSIMPVKVLDDIGEGTYSAIADGVYHAANNGAKVINMSLGGSGYSTTLRNAVQYAYNNGVTIVCATGNEYNEGNPTTYPAAYNSYCIAVGATRYDRTRAPYSNTGSYVDLVAPGGDLDVDQNNDGYGDGILQQTFAEGDPTDFGYYFYDGTSMATPHVSGIAAMLISLGITDPDDVREALESTARDLGSTGKDNQYGWGLVDAYAALDYYRSMGDFNADGSSDMDDLAMLIENWLTSDGYADITPETGDGIVNFRDFAVFSQLYGS
ncbi:Thermophilic serine proteinase precursor [Anaerohalosphaera lusitana]|uniref:Thermophilic serine proteinase n=1 Tax=Anaerohalosphaera lusitana TaxID=1936003 RepID=A0A1U9NI88_9BACT|nr:S8 family serine peptidase [Anaerohalosphaera lusitana]AQT67226.1 Thermophilic serine proteinase precursor [Anaerohalosphaera lusitana]